MIISVGDEGAIFSRINSRGRLLSRHFFVSSRDKDYQQFMHQHQEDMIYVLLDVTDQEFTRETFPPVSRLNVIPLVQRKIRTDYDPSLDITKAVSLGRDSTRDRGWQYLFANIRNHPPLSDWLKDILLRRNSFAGIIPAPFVMRDMAMRLAQYPPKKRRKKPHNKVHPDWHIYLSLQRVGGIRQVVMHQGNIMFSRITAPVGEYKPDVLSGHVHQEVLNTIEFIRRLGFEDEQGLEIMTVAGKEVCDALKKLTFPTPYFQTITPLDAAKPLHIGTGLEQSDQFGDVLTSLYFSKHTQRYPRLFNKEAKHKRSAYYLSRILRLVILVFTLSLCTILGWWGYHYLSLRSKHDGLSQEIATVQSQLAEQRFDLAVGGYSVEQIGSIVATHAASERVITTIEDTLSHIARISTAFGIKTKDIRITSSAQHTHTRIKLSIDQAFSLTDQDPWENKLQRFEQYAQEIRTALHTYRLQFKNVPTSTEISLDVNETNSRNKPTEFSFTLEVSF